jgi:hypothetical protein
MIGFNTTESRLSMQDIETMYNDISLKHKILYKRKINDNMVNEQIFAVFLNMMAVTVPSDVLFGMVIVYEHAYNIL